MLGSRGPMWIPVMQQLLDRIVNGTYAEGSVLPSERELSEEFDVSRTVLRESVKVLTEKGLVSTWRGRGTIVEPADRWRTFDPDILAARLRYPGGETVIRELLALRRGIEPVLASMAAANADDAQRQDLQGCYEELQACLHDPGAYVDADGIFHRQIATISGVSLAIDLFDLMTEPFAVTRRGTAQIPGGLRHAHEEHGRVFDRIMAGDAPGAADAMKEHIDSAEQRLQRLRWAEQRLVL